jgi:L-lysine exporter family protein LysE/ArgO
MTSAAIGFVTSLGLIVAIGAQNAFVLRLGLRRQHVLPIVLVCSLSDAALINAGIAGLGAALTANPALMQGARYGGAAFIIGYGLLAARRALHPQSMTFGTDVPVSLSAALLTCLGFTFLNPHVYLDTMVLLGTIGNQHGDDRWWFAAGATLGSVVWFVALGYGAGFLSKFFERPRSWQILDGAISAIMIALGLALVLH